MFNLIIVDFQKDFYDKKEGALYVPNAEIALNNIKSFIKDHIKEIHTVYVTKDAHPENHCSFIDNGGKWPSHCVINTPGSKVHPDILNLCNEYNLKVIELNKGVDTKNEQYSAFAVSDNCLILNSPITTFIVCGLAGDYCVMETYKDMVKINQNICALIYTPGCASIDDEQFKSLIKTHKVLTIN